MSKKNNYKHAENQINYGENLCVSSTIHGNLDGGSEWWSGMDYWSEVEGNCREVVDRENFDIEEWIEIDGQNSNTETSGLLEESIRYADEQINPDLRNVRLELVGDYPEKYKKEYPKDKKVWIISHGWCGGPDGFKIAGKNIKKDESLKNDIVLQLDWREASWNGVGTDVCRAATWTRPLSFKIKEKLSEWGLGESDYKNVRLVGHSLGTILNTELGLKTPVGLIMKSKNQI